MANIHVVFVFTLENSPSDSINNPTSLPPMIEGYGRKRKKRTSIETNIKLTLEKRFLDVSSRLNPYLIRFYNKPSRLSKLKRKSCFALCIHVYFILKRNMKNKFSYINDIIFLTVLQLPLDILTH